MDRGLPPRRHRRDRRGLNGGGFYSGGDARAAYLSELRLRFGGDTADRVERSLALGEHPRPLTGDERGVLEETVAPVLRDLIATGALVPDLRAEAHEERDDHVCGWIRGPGGTGTGVSIYLARPVPERIAELTEQLQEWEIEELASAGRPATWPECPEHPNAHPLEPVVTDQQVAVWRCPRSGRVAGQIGALGR